MTREKLDVYLKLKVSPPRQEDVRMVGDGNMVFIL